MVTIVLCLQVREWKSTRKQNTNVLKEILVLIENGNVNKIFFEASKIQHNLMKRLVESIGNGAFQTGCWNSVRAYSKKKPERLKRSSMMTE